MLRSVDNSAVPPVGVVGDDAADSFNRMVNHMLRSGLMLASAMSLEPLDERVRARLDDAIAELDGALAELRHTAIAPFLQASANADVRGRVGIDDATSTLGIAAVTHVSIPTDTRSP